MSTQIIREPGGQAEQACRTTLGPSLIALLGVLCVLGPSSMSVVVPALPAIADDLGTSNASAQAGLTLCVLGIAVGQTGIGPLSDRLGRRGPLLVALSLWSLAALLSVGVTHIVQLHVLRFLQGVGGGVAMALARAVVRDLAAPEDLLRGYARLALVSGVAPIVSPLIGSLVLQIAPWPVVFATLAVVGVATLASVWRWLPESLPARVEPRSGGALRDLAALAADRGFVVGTVAAAAGYASIFTYVSLSSFVYDERHDVSALTFSLLFGLNGLGHLLAAQASIRLGGRWGTRRLIVIGLLVAIIATVAMGVFDRFAGEGHLSWLALAVPLWFMVSAVGLVVPPATAWAMGAQGDRAATASGVLGVVQFGSGALVATLAGFSGGASAVPLALATGVSLLIAAVAVVASSLRGARPLPSTHLTKEP